MPYTSIFLPIKTFVRDVPVAVFVVVFLNSLLTAHKHKDCSTACLHGSVKVQVFRVFLNDRHKKHSKTENRELNFGFPAAAN